ncbi:MAG TPA: DUF6056 family protein [Phototrophicaceae bacterium]|nr:DUF6056 family protein [Phototrophicaceae bacterium]
MTKTHIKVFPILLIASLLLPLLLFAYTGLNSRYIADDYCWPVTVHSQGIFNAIATWYNTWYGRYTQMLIMGVIAALGPEFVPIYPALIVIGWLALLIWSANQGLQWGHFPQAKKLSVIAGSLILFATLDSTPSLIQALYWMSGTVAYIGSLIALTFIIGFLFYTLRRHTDYIPLRSHIILAVATFAGGGLSETYAVLQIAILGLIFLGCLLFAPAASKRPLLRLLGVGVFFSILALMIVLVAPGNTVRQAHFSRLPLLQVAWMTFYVSFSYLFVSSGLFAPVTMLVASLLPMFVVYQLDPLEARLRLRPRQVGSLLALSALITLILVMACIAPAIYTMATPPAARVYVIPQLILVCLAVFWGSVLGLGARWRQPRLKPATQLMTSIMIIGLLVIGPLASTGQTLAELPDFQTYATEWDTRDQTIRAAAASGQRVVETRMLSVDIGSRAGLEPIGPEANTGVNSCAEHYYGLEALSARTLLQMGSKTPPSVN